MPTEFSEKPHFPHKLRGDEWYYNLKKCVQWVEDGMKPKDAIMSIFQLSLDGWKQWNKFYRADVEAGYTAKDSRLIKLYEELAKADGTLHHKLVKNSTEMALDGNTEMSKFLLERRCNYKKPSKEVEVSTKENTQFNINITESKPRDE